MKHYCFLILVCLIFLLQSNSQAQSVTPDFLWAKTANPTSISGYPPCSSQGESIAVDRWGNSYITGYFSHYVSFGNIILTTIGSLNGLGMFITKYDPSGNVIWAKASYGGAVAHEDYEIAVDSLGNSFVIGRFYGSVSFGTFTLTSTGSSSMFIAKYDPSGNVIWARAAGGTGSNICKSIAVDGSGNSYITGHFLGSSATFGNITLTSIYNYTVFITKLDAAGNTVWARKGVSSNHAEGISLVVDKLGNSYTTGYFISDVTFGTTTLTSSVKDFFIVKYDAGGNLIWAQKGNSSQSVDVFDIALDVSGNSYLTGYFNSNGNPLGGNVTIGTATLTSIGHSDVFIIKYDPSGNLLWARQGGGPYEDYGHGIAVDSSGNYYVIGGFNNGFPSSGSITFGTTTLNSNGDGEIFIVKFDTAGNLVWARKAGGIARDDGMEIAIDKTGNIYITGGYEISSTFGTTTLTTNSGGEETFIAKIGTDYNIVTKSLPPILCAGNSFKVPFTVSTPFSTGNNFVAQLSDSTGSFSNALNIGSLVSTNSDTINAVIPANIVLGIKYRIRVIGTTPSTVGLDNGSNLTLIQKPLITAQASASAITVGDSIILSISNPIAGLTYTWSGNNLNTTSGSSVKATPSSAGIYIYSVTASNSSCSSTDTISVKVAPLIISGDVGIIHVSKPALIGCYSNAEGVRVWIQNFGTTANSNIPVEVRVSGAATATMTATFTRTLQPGDTASLVMGTLHMSNKGTYTFTARTLLPGDTDPTNNSWTETRSFEAVKALPLTPVTLTGFDGTNLSTLSSGWSEAVGYPMPVKTNSDWGPAVNATQLAGMKSETATIRFNNSTKRHWIIGPKVVPTANTRLYFEAAVTGAGNANKAQMGPDDKLLVMVSTDCGVTFNPLYEVARGYDLPQALTMFTLKLNQYVGQEIIVGLLAYEGTTARSAPFDLHLDNILIGDPGIYGTVKGQCLTTRPTWANGNSEWKELVQDGQVVGAINDYGTDLGTVSVDFHLNDAAQNGMLLDKKGHPMVGRYFKINATNHVFTGQQVGLRLYVLNSEIDELVNTPGSKVGSVNDLQLVQYSGQNENCFNADNDTTTATTITNYYRQDITKIPYQNGYLLEVTVSDHFSELYLKADPNPNTPLPVTLVNFKASRKGEDALLEWQTATEQNNAGFDVEVSKDARRFRKLGFVEGKGTSASYSFTDQATGKTGTRYYRLKQVDFDGGISYSPIHSVSFDDKNSGITVWPNPFSDKLTIALTAATHGPTQLKITDMMGRVITTTQLDLKKGKQQLELELDNNLAKGLYLLELTINQQQNILKIVKE